MRFVSGMSIRSFYKTEKFDINRSGLICDENEVLLVFPRIEHGATTYKDKGSWIRIFFGYPIITLPHMAAITPKKHDVEIVNENHEEIDFDEQIRSCRYNMLYNDCTTCL